MIAGAADGPLGAVVGTVLLVVALWRVRIRRLEIVYGEEFGHFAAYVLAIAMVWWGMGVLAFVPFIGPNLGWPWIPQFLARIDWSDPIRSLLGLVFAFGVVIALTVVGYTESYQRLFLKWRSFPFAYTAAGRWTMALASAYLAALVLDLLRLIYMTDPMARMTGAGVGEIAGYIGVIAGAPVFGRLLQKTGTPLRVAWIVQLAAVLVMNSLTGRLLRTGSVHLGPLAYADFVRGFTGSLPGLATIIAAVLVAGTVMARRTVRTRKKMTQAAKPTAKAPAAVQTQAAAAPEPAASTVRWRRFDKAKGRRVDWP